MGADYGTHGGAVPSRQSRRCPRAFVIEPQAYDRARAHAIEPPALCRLDTATHPANEIGPKTSALIEIILREKTHPEQGFRATIGILRHANSFGNERLEAACGRALEIGARSYTSVTSILKTNLDRRRPASATDGPAIVHANIRGPRYFH